MSKNRRGMEMILVDEDDNSICYCEVGSVEEAQAIWTKVASIRYSALVCFRVLEDGDVLYRGDYTSDEC